MAQVESSYDEFTKRNAAVVVIAAQKIEGLFRGKEHVQRKKYPFPVLFDETRKVTRAYGVYHALGTDAYNIAHPATFVIGPGGKISWIGVSPNQHERPQLSDILSAIEACDKY
jgi:peroxiredoxin